MKLTLCLFVLLLFLSSATAINGQTKIKEFRSISCPEKKWALKHLFVANSAFRATKEARKQTNSLLTDSVLDQYINGGKIDAFRHVFWMALLTTKIGEKKARSLGNAHEKGNYLFFLRGKNEEGEPSDSISGIMDLNNNEIGILIGKSNPKIDINQLKLVVIDSIKEGKCLILKRNAEGKKVNCKGEIATSAKKWGLPYCLIKSNESP